MKWITNALEGLGEFVLLAKDAFISFFTHRLDFKELILSKLPAEVTQVA